jgi:hypothetical protein
MKAILEIVKLSADIVTTSTSSAEPVLCSIPGMTTDCPEDGF